MSTLTKVPGRNYYKQVSPTQRGFRSVTVYLDSEARGEDGLTEYERFLADRAAWMKANKGARAVDFLRMLIARWRTDGRPQK